MKVQCGPGRWPKMLECMLCMRGPRFSLWHCMVLQALWVCSLPSQKFSASWYCSIILSYCFFFSTGEISDGVMPLFSLCKILTWVITSLCEHLHVNVCCLIRLHAPGVWLFIFKSSNQGVWNIQSNRFHNKGKNCQNPEFLVKITYFVPKP